MIRRLSTIFWVPWVLCSAAIAEDFNPTNATLDELFFHAQRYGNKPERLARKKAATRELYARGEDGLRYLVDRMHSKNIWYWIHGYQANRQLEEEKAVPLLLEYLEAERPKTKSYAAFFLSFYETPEHADALLPLLDHEKSDLTAIRTMGKWKVAEKTIQPYLADDREKARITAANALRDVGATNAVPDLIKALEDPVFTVRKCAARALTTLGEPAERALIENLGQAKGRALRETIRALGVMKSEAARKSLESLLTHGDEFVRRDAAEALRGD